ncbi:MAG: PQQ-dependent sugar dehydrogenase [Pseudomonadota bacterium]
MISPINPMLNRISFLFLLFFLISTSLKAQDQNGPNFSVERLAKGPGIPWGMTFLETGRLLVSDKSGQLILFDLETDSVNFIEGVPAVVNEGQGGLLDVAAGPDFKNNHWVYLTYAKPIQGEAATALARAKIIGTRLTQWEDLLVTDSVSNSRRHFGSRIAFDYQGHVFFSVGDRGDRDQAQNGKNHIGSIIRLHLDGRVPKDNPFVDDPSMRDEIWSYGHRNPQGLYFDRQTLMLWSIEHGPRGGDEINLIRKGFNYGWPVISYGKEYWGPFNVGEDTERDGMEQPVKQFTPSIAPGSLIVYRGKAFPQWQGSLFSGALKLRHLNRIWLNQNNQAVGEQRLLSDMKLRIRALQEGPDGYIYFSTDNGEILRIKPEEGEN